MSSEYQQTTPDKLLDSFRGRSLKSIILFTIILHLVVIGGSSIPYFLKSMSSKTDSKLSEQERLELAAREATSTLRDIAAKHGIKPQDLSARISGDSPTAAPKPTAPTPPEQPAAPAPNEEEKPKTAIEEELEVKKEGPAVPPIPTDEAEEEDLFR